MAVVRVSYYTDPACPWSWALEPALRKLLVTFGENLELTYVMAGMASEFGDAKGLAEETLEASASTAMPVDARIWFQNPPRSSYPACIAVIAAAEQGNPSNYLRRLREAILCRRRRLDTGDALLEEARAAGGIDVERLRIALGSHAMLEAFGADLERSKAVPAEHHADGGRVKLPSLEFRSVDGDIHGVYGFASYEALAAAALDAGARPVDYQPPSPEQALSILTTMATAEIAMVCELPGPRAPAELWRLASEWRVKPERLGSGELWTLA
ncbi:MAG: DsbA family protein [Solirubrobacterales bacterium]|nr:DsbA family protein [Solirubrobacterales bacterium]